MCVSENKLAVSENDCSNTSVATSCMPFHPPLCTYLMKPECLEPEEVYITNYNSSPPISPKLLAHVIQIVIKLLTSVQWVCIACRTSSGLELTIVRQSTLNLHLQCTDKKWSDFF